MKTAIIGTICAALAVLTIVIVLTISGGGTRQTNLENDLSDALETSVKEILVEAKSNGTIHTEEEMKAALVENIMAGVNDNSISTKVNLIDLDMNKGLVSVEVVKEYKQVNGNTSTVSATKTVIVDQPNTARTYQDYTVKYYIDDWVYASYTIREGDDLIQPDNPTQKGSTFAGWAVKGTTQVVTIPDKIHGNVEYVAVFR